MSLQFNSENDCIVKIKVIGVGGAGNNAINSMIEHGVHSVDFLAINTDIQALKKSKANSKLQIGEKLTKGQGAGSNPEIGRKSAEESKDIILDELKDVNMVFITAGMGGGTGTGGAPIVAQLAKELGILTVGVVTKPFSFEGKKRIEQAILGIDELRKNVDALLIIPNDRLKFVSEQKVSFKNGFEIADGFLKQAVASISELITVPGYINVDFADVVSVMKDAGYAHMGVGKATGKDKAQEAVKAAIESPLLETSIKGAKGILLNIVCSPDVELEEVENAAAIVQQAGHEDAHIIFGAFLDDKMNDEIRVVIVATGFDNKSINIKKDNKEQKSINKINIIKNKNDNNTYFNEILSVLNKK